MRKTIVAMVVAALAATTGGVLYPTSAFGASVTCSGNPGTLPGTTIDANVYVPAGSLCLISFQTINGNISVSPGGGLLIERSGVNGNIASSAAGAFSGFAMCSFGAPFSIGIRASQVNGNVAVTNSTGNVGVCDSPPARTAIRDVLTLDGNKAGVAVAFTSVGNNAYVTNTNPGPTTVVSNTVTGNLTCTGNANVTSSGNTAKQFVGPDCH